MCRRIFHILALSMLAPFAALPAAANGPDTDLAKMAWITGEWQRTDLPAGESGFERWQATQSSGYAGIGVHQRGNGSRFEETLSIEIRGDAIHYVAKTPQNPEPVAFRLIELREDGATFENRGHDFPKRIDYRRDGERGLIVRISDDDKTIDFRFQRSD